jgi:hypothetical protein
LTIIFELFLCDDLRAHQQKETLEMISKVQGIDSKMDNRMDNNTPSSKCESISAQDDEIITTIKESSANSMKISNCGSSASRLTLRDVQSSYLSSIVRNLCLLSMHIARPKTAVVEAIEDNANSSSATGNTNSSSSNSTHVTSSGARSNNPNNTTNSTNPDSNNPNFIRSPAIYRVSWSVASAQQTRALQYLEAGFGAEGLGRLLMQFFFPGRWVLEDKHIEACTFGGVARTKEKVREATYLGFGVLTAD